MSWNNKLKFYRTVFNSKKIIHILGNDYKLLVKGIIKKPNSKSIFDIKRLSVDAIYDDIILLIIHNKYYKPRKNNLLCRFNYFNFI